MKFMMFSGIRRAQLMFVLAVLWLVIFGIILILLSDKYSVPLWGVMVLGFVWLIIIYDVIAGRLNGEPVSNLRLISSILVPTLRISQRDHLARIWFPRIGWKREIDEPLFNHLEQQFLWPSISAALVMLVVFGLSFLAKKYGFDTAEFWLAYSIVQGLIWSVFALEFIVMMPLAEKRLKYSMQNWLTIIIIVLPVLAALRSLAFLRVFNLTRVAQTMRLRGTTTRLLKAAIILDVIMKVVHRTPEKQVAYLNEKRTALQKELEDLDEKIAKLEVEANSK